VNAAPNDLLARYRRGDRRALARLMTMAERGEAAFEPAFDALFPSVGRALRVGFTGPPGAGKSTLVSQLTSRWRVRGSTVGICAIDPSSQQSGGALLGDRVRMNTHLGDAGVFIRSMATRGVLGGLSRAAAEICDLLDAFGFVVVVVETTGVGQSELDVMDVADTVVVVLHPGAGDDVQAMKSGLLEIADVLVINKADLPGADRLENDLMEMLELRAAGQPDAVPPTIVRAEARNGAGVDQVLAGIVRHGERLRAGGHLGPVRLRKRLAQLRRRAEQRIAAKLWSHPQVRVRLEAAAAGAAPYAAVDRLVEDLLGGRFDDSPGGAS
jgi:LAO/AO transport system kinase